MTSVHKPSARLLILGDSITYGAWDSLGGWADRLRQANHRMNLDSKGKHTAQILNLGISGDTSTGLLKRIKSEVNARCSPDRDCSFMVAIGTNDSRQPSGSSQTETPTELFRHNIEEILDFVLSKSKRVLLVGLPPLGEKKVELFGQLFTRDLIKSYDDILTEVAKSKGVEKIDLFNLFLKGDNDNKELYSVDNLHPSDAGHKLIADQVEPYSIKYLAP